MHGNLWQWVWDGQDEADYPGDPVTDPVSATDSYRVHRGGSWFACGPSCRAANRYRLVPGARDPEVGLRPARTGPAP